jgi:diphthine methyl ester synthase
MDKESLVIGLARVGSETQKIIACSQEKMAGMDIGEPLHCLVVPGELHPLEEEYLEQYLLK